MGNPDRGGTTADETEPSARDTNQRMAMGVSENRITCSNETCRATCHNEFDALLRRWEWTQTETGAVIWLCRRCHLEGE